jgi:hypothetical protein
LDHLKGVECNSRPLGRHNMEVGKHYSFVSSLEPFRVEEALQDPDWVLVMQEELNNFKRNEVWSLVPRPKQTLWEPSGCSATSKTSTEW